MVKGESATAWNREVQVAIAAGIQVLILHHDTKKPLNSDGTSRTPTIDRLYGSTFVTAGMGSVLHLDQTDNTLKLRQLKPVVEQQPTLVIQHDNTTGRTIISANDNQCEILAAIGPNGATTQEINQRLGATNDISKQALKRALERLMKARLISCERPAKRGMPNRYRLQTEGITATAVCP